MNRSNIEGLTISSAQPVIVYGSVRGLVDRRLDLSGQKFGRWTALRRDPTITRRPHWLCRCECGTERVVDGRQLRHGISRSCGCLQREIARELGALSNLKHGKRRSNEYRIWNGIRTRCLNPRDGAYKNYGGRGITICDRWNDFSAFLADMGQRPSPMHTIDRIDNDGPYSPGNCRWSTYRENIANRRNTIRAEFRGEKKTLADIADILGVTYGAIWRRYSNGWPLEAVGKARKSAPRGES